MARDPDSLKIRKWAENGNVADPSTVGITRSDGWGTDYSAPGGKTPEREVFNELFRELTAMLVEINKRGVLEWDGGIFYGHPAAVMGSDGQVYLTVAGSFNVDPVSNTARSAWTPLLGSMAERDVYFSTSTPTSSNGRNGDVWFKYTT